MAPLGIFNPCYHKLSPQTLSWPTSTVHWSETPAPAAPGSVDPAGIIYLFAGRSTGVRHPKSMGSGYSSQSVETFPRSPVEACPAPGLSPPRSTRPKPRQRGFPGTRLLQAGFQTHAFPCGALSTLQAYCSRWLLHPRCDRTQLWPRGHLTSHGQALEGCFSDRVAAGGRGVALLQGPGGRAATLQGLLVPPRGTLTYMDEPCSPGSAGSCAQVAGQLVPQPGPAAQSSLAADPPGNRPSLRFSVSMQSCVPGTGSV